MVLEMLSRDRKFCAESVWREADQVDHRGGGTKHFSVATAWNFRQTRSAWGPSVPPLSVAGGDSHGASPRFHGPLWPLLPLLTLCAFPANTAPTALCGRWEGDRCSGHHQLTLNWCQNTKASDSVSTDCEVSFTPRVPWWDQAESGTFPKTTCLLGFFPCLVLIAHYRLLLGALP